MIIHSPTMLNELLARLYYCFLNGWVRVKQPTLVEYRHRRWYRRDRQQRVIKIARTYFDVMQPCGR